MQRRVDADALPHRLQIRPYGKRPRRTGQFQPQPGGRLFEHAPIEVHFTANGTAQMLEGHMVDIGGSSPPEQKAGRIAEASSGTR